MRTNTHTYIYASLECMGILYHDQNRLIQVFIPAFIEERNRIKLRNR